MVTGNTLTQADASSAVATPALFGEPREGAAGNAHTGCAQRDFPQRIESELPFLKRIVRRWHPDAASADDLVQDTVLRALANARSWQPGSDLRAWLYTIMRNQFLAAIARRNLTAAALETMAVGDPRIAPDPGEARLVIRDLERALRRLPLSQRAAVLSVGVEGKSYDEAARHLGISAAAVRCHLARARDRLRTAITGGADAVPFAAPPTRAAGPLPPTPAAVAFYASALAEAD